MINNNNYMNFIADPKFLNGNRDEDLYFLFQDKMILVKEDMGKVIIPTFKEINNLIDGLEIMYHLGKLNEVNCFCGEINSCVKVSGELKFIPLRQGSSLIDKDIFSVCGRAAQIIHFHKTNKFCGVCGGENEFVGYEFAMKCSKCGYMSYPQVCPAIIVGITRENTILLANNKNFPKGLHSNVAGFVDVNETLEEAVKREVLEEVNIRVKNIKYFSSQPWPYPNSIMIGFIAEYDGGEIKVDGKEIMHADWYSKDNLPILPDENTIARKIIDEILNNVLK